MNFAKNLSIMLRSGISINEALTLLSEQSVSLHFSIIIRRVRDSVENGNPLSAAFLKEVKVFGTIFVSMVKAGEQSGTLQGNLQFLAEWISRSADLRREVAAATLYPKVVFAAALLLGGGLAVFILPRLIPLFTSLDVELPLITKMLLAVSVYVQESWLPSISVVLLSVLGFTYINRIRVVRKVFHSGYLRVPLFGALLKNYQLALITQLFSTLLRSGLTLNEAVEIIAHAATNICYEEALHQIQTSVERGTTLSASMGAYEFLFPKIVANIISVGEKSGTLVNSFEYLSEFYTKEVNAETRQLPTIIEPILLVFIAGIVGFVALAIITPIYELTGNISR